MAESYAEDKESAKRSWYSRRNKEEWLAQHLVVDLERENKQLRAELDILIPEVKGLEDMVCNN